MKTKKQFIAMALIAIIGIIGITACDDSSNDNNDFVVQNSTPVVADFNIVGIGTFTYDGNPKAVTVTKKEGKTGGTITVKYNGETTAPSAVNTYTVTFDVTAAEGWSAASGLNAGTLVITDKTLTGIAITTQPTKTDYNLNEDLDTTGMVVTATYSDNSEEPVSGYAVNGYDKTTLGSQSITVTYNDETAIFTVNVLSKPIVSIIYETTEIPQNGTIDLDTVIITLSKTFTIVIKNVGTETLTLDTANTTITGAEALAFTKLTDPDADIQAGEQTSFDIKFEPVKLGENKAVLTISTNDSFRNQVEVNLEGLGMSGTSILYLTQIATVITNNSLTPFDFGSVGYDVVYGDSKKLNFTIKNIGNADLLLTGDPVITSSKGTFTVFAQPANTTISPGESTEFTIEFTPSGANEDSGYLTILNNGKDGDYTINIKGTGYLKQPHIEIYSDVHEYEIQQNGTINAGDQLISDDPDDHDNPGFKNITVTIKNTGEIPLTIVPANITITGDEAAAFTITSNPDTSIQPGNESTFRIKCKPVKAGINTAVLTIPSNDNSRNPFVVNLKLTGIDD